MGDQDGAGLSQEQLDRFEENFTMNEKYIFAQNVCTTFNLSQVVASRAIKQKRQHIYNHQLKELKPVSNQHQSGRCWIYAMTNCMRFPFMAKHGLTEFEFSQNYIFFWDKIERSNYMIHCFVDAARKGETCTGRLVTHLLSNPTNDGGQWDMLTNIVEKYGIVPKSCYPEAQNGQNSRNLGKLLNLKLREYCLRLHKMVTDGATDDALIIEKNKMMEEVYRINCICLGTPPSVVEYDVEKVGKAGGLNKVWTFGPMSPLEFYRQHVKPDFDMEQMVCLVNDPRPENPYEHLYTVEYLGNMIGGRDILYINKEIGALKKLAAQALTVDKQPVWFGCDVGQFRSTEGICDMDILEYSNVFDVDFQGMSKSERLMYGQSLMTHAMVFTGVNVVADKSNIKDEKQKTKTETKAAEDTETTEKKKVGNADEGAETADKGIADKSPAVEKAVETSDKGVGDADKGVITNGVVTAEKGVGDADLVVDTANEGGDTSANAVITAEKGVGGSETMIETAEKGVGDSEQMVDTAEKGVDTAEQGNSTAEKVDGSSAGNVAESAEKEGDTAEDEETIEPPKDLTANRWKVENSWGDAHGVKGYFQMTDEWFSENVFEIVVHKKLLDPETLAILEQKPRMLPAWDPMGALARC